MQKFDYHWRKAINITAWVVQFLVCIILIGISAWALAVIGDYRSYLGNEVHSLFAASAGINIGIALLTAIINILEIVFIAKHVMSPAIYLSFACTKTLVWLVLFILAVLGRSPAWLVFSLAVSATALMQLVYGAVIVNRHRKGTLRGGKYAPAATGHVEGAAHAHPHGVHDISSNYYYSQPAYGGPYAGADNISNSNGHNATTEYKSPVPSPQPQAQYGYAPPSQAPQVYHHHQQPHQYYGGATHPASGSYELDNRANH